MQASSVDVGYKANNHLLFLGQWIQSNIASVILEVSISPRLRLGLIDTSRITSAMLDCTITLAVDDYLLIVQTIGREFQRHGAVN